MKELLSLFLIFSFYSNTHLSQDKRELLNLADKVVDHYWEINNNFQKPEDVNGNYKMDLAFEGMLAIDRSLGDDYYLQKVKKVMNLRGLDANSDISYKSQPFGCLTFELFRATKDSSYLSSFISESVKMYEEVKRSPEGAIMLNHQGGYYVLIDRLQEYASRIAKLGYLTNEEKYYEECVSQFEIYRAILRDPLTGLYSQGRGWLEDRMELSPGAWSRGHGWLIRGMVRSIEFLPQNSNYYARLQKILLELSTDLIKVQDDKGMWHQLLHLPFEDSYPETSGTSLIVYYMALAIKEGYLPDTSFQKSVKRSFGTLKNYIGEDGTIYGTCVGPGPLYTIHPWYRTAPLPDDPHGFGSLLFAMAGELILLE